MKHDAQTYLNSIWIKRVDLSAPSEWYRATGNVNPHTQRVPMKMLGWPPHLGNIEVRVDALFGLGDGYYEAHWQHVGWLSAPEDEDVADEVGHERA